MSEIRKALKPKDSAEDILYKMSEGNPGAISVLSKLILCYSKEIDPSKWINIVMDIDDMNIRGSQIWISYKDHCKEDLEEFIKCCIRRDQKMIDEVNKWCGKNHEWIAVKNNGSLTRKRHIQEI